MYPRGQSMFNIKVFADFSAAAITDNGDQDLLDELIRVKNSTQARYVNLSLCDYQRNYPESIHVLTYPLTWISHYIRYSYGDIDPIPKIDLRKVTAVDWNGLKKSASQQQLFDKFEQFKIGNSGITVSVHAGGSQYFALSFIFLCEPSSWDSLRSTNIEKFHMEAERLVRRYLEIFEPGRQPECILTPREREVLGYVAQGRTDAQVADLMGIGKWTVVTHMQSAKYKLGCSNRAAAVAKAVSYGLIDIKHVV